MSGALWATVLALVAGVPLAIALPRRGLPPWPALAGEGYLLGITAQFVVLLVTGLCGLPWNGPLIVVLLLMIAIAATAIAYRRIRASDERIVAGTHGSLVDLVTLLLVAGYCRFATMAPAVEIDYVCIWGLKAREFLAARGIDWQFLTAPYNAFAHVDYPLLVPLTYDFQAILGGGFDERWVGAVTAGCGIATLLVLRSFLAEEFGGIFVSLATLVLMPLAFSPYVAIAEGPLIAFGTTGLLYLRRSLRLSSNADVLRGAAFLGLAACCKNEGLTLIIAAAIPLILLGRNAAIRLWPAVAIPLPWLVIRTARGLQSDMLQSGMTGRALSRLADPIPIVRAMVAYPAGHVLLWSGIIFSLLIGVRSVTRGERFLASAIALQMLALIAAYLVTPHDVSWHIRWSWERLVLQLTPAFTFLALVVIAPWMMGAVTGRPAARSR